MRDGQRHMAPPHRLAIELSGQDTWRRLPPTDPLIAKRRSSNHRITAKRFSPSGDIAPGWRKTGLNQWFRPNGCRVFLNRSEISIAAVPGTGFVPHARVFLNTSPLPVVKTGIEANCPPHHINERTTLSAHVLDAGRGFAHGHPTQNGRVPFAWARLF